MNKHLGSNATLHEQNPMPANAKKMKQKHTFLGRKNSIRDVDDGFEGPTLIGDGEGPSGPRTAPLRENRDTMAPDNAGNDRRNRSADRQTQGWEQPLNDIREEGGRRKESSGHSRGQPSVFLSRDTHSMFSMKGLGKNTKSFLFGGRSKGGGGPDERAPNAVDEPYTLKVLNLPLIEQTRITRISKSLQTSRDKTEYWMPAIAWRLIDYLNYRGTEQEGLYRVSGSQIEIKKYQKRFDTGKSLPLRFPVPLY